MAEPRQSLSVVIAAHNGRAEVENCLASLREQELPADSSTEVEIIVVGSFSDETAAALKKLYPGVRLLRTNSPLSVPHLRSWGLREATGNFVALLEDHCTPAPGWYRAILSSHASNQKVVGGAVEMDSAATLVDWAVYLFEYSSYMNPITRGRANQLPGNNVSYERVALRLLDDLLDQYAWEAVWHKRLIENGISLIANPDMVVRHRRSFSASEFWRLARLHAHNFAASRTWEPAGKQWLWISGAAVLPLVLFFRIGRTVLAKRRHWKRFIAASPLILWFTCGWTCGEITGSITRRHKPEIGWLTGAAQI